MINIIIILISAILSIVFFINSKNIANIFDLYDFPNERKIHKEPIPLIGGLILLLVLTVFYILIIFLSDFDVINSHTLIISIYIITIFGILDDKKDIRANIKLLFFIFFFLIHFFLNDYLVINNLKFSSFNYDFNLGIFSIIFTTLCSLLLINAINMSDGINGLSASIQIIIFLFLIYFNFNNISLTNSTSNFSDYFIIFSSFYILILIIFLIFNMYEKVFLGDGGTFLISFILINSLLFNYKNLQFFYPENILMLLWIPGLDMLRVFIIRILSKKNPFNPDRNHFHHILKKIFNNNIYCLIYYITLILLSNISVIKYPQHSLIILILTSAIYFMTIYFGKKKT